MVQTGVDQPGCWVGNSAASLSSRGPGSAVAAQHGRDDRDGYVDSARRRHARHIDGPLWRTPWCSSGCRDRSGCRSVRQCGNRRTRSVVRAFPLAVGANGEECRERLRHDILRAHRRPWQKEGTSGRGIGAGLAVGPGVAPAFPLAEPLFTRSARLPHSVCQTTMAAPFIRRKPCGPQTEKPAYLCLKFKNKIHPANSPRLHVDARFLRKIRTAYTSNVGHRTCRIVLIGAMSSKRWLITHSM